MLRRNKSTTTSKQRGAIAEKNACMYLKGRGLEFIAGNYRCAHGEIDLIMREKETLVFVEVRSRKNTQFGIPSETIDWRKQKKLRATASHYLQCYANYADMPCRFDVIAIDTSAPETGPLWLQNAF